jgi:hypothetical protein
MTAMIFKVPPHWGHCSMSISEHAFSSRAQLMGAGAAGGGTSAWSAALVVVAAGSLDFCPMI